MVPQIAAISVRFPPLLDIMDLVFITCFEVGLHSLIDRIVKIKPVCVNRKPIKRRKPCVSYVKSEGYYTVYARSPFFVVGLLG